MYRREDGISERALFVDRTIIYSIYEKYITRDPFLLYINILEKRYLGRILP